MPQVRNPILPGFHPDPSIIRVGDDYYIATSTFEWYPGVEIHHSRDLANWTLIPQRPLRRARQLDMRGDPDSCGVWAPCLSHDGERFWLVYTDVKRKDGSFKDTPNYIVWAAAIEGPWSDPVLANRSGFDPSLFHDPDTGKKWFLNMLQDHRRRPRFFPGIVMQEFDPAQGQLVGPRRIIFRGTELDLVEGPHLYRRGGWYYLLTAEGGTAYGHACTLARSRDIWGPYETHPQNPILTSKNSPFAALQRAGHGDLVDTPDGRTFLVHLAGRPVTQSRRCVLGRETAIQECHWRDDGWLYVADGPVPSLHVDVPGTRDDSAYWREMRYSFSPDPPPTTTTASAGHAMVPADEEEGRDAAADALHPDFQWLRTPEPSRILSLAANPGRLTLYGRESIGSWFEQSLVARRQAHFSYDAETVLGGGYAPVDERQFAGLTAYYCRYNFFYLAVSADDPSGDGSAVQRELLVMQSEASWPDGNIKLPMVEPVPIPATGRVKLAMRIRGGQTLQFSYALEQQQQKDGGSDISGHGSFGEMVDIGPVLDASLLSDECGGHQAHGSFTGAFVGLAASDINGTALPAEFEYFIYRPVQDVSDRYDI